MNASLKAIFNILISTLIIIVYVALVVIPFFVNNSPPNEATSQWSYNNAPLHYALLFYPIVALYCISVVKNIFNVKSFRCIIYPICFCMLFVLCHMCFFVLSAVILFVCIITIPLGALILFFITIFALVLDIKSFKNIEIPIVNKDDLQKELNIIAFILIPLCLLGGIFVAYTIAKSQPHESTTLCENLNVALQQLTPPGESKEVQFEKLVEQYTTEFNNKKKYGPIFGNYDIVKTETGISQEASNENGQWITKEIKSLLIRLYDDNELAPVASIDFSMSDNTCDISSQNCVWTLTNTKSHCVFFMDNKGSIKADKRTNAFLKHK